MNEKPDIFDRIMTLPLLNKFNGFYKKNKAVLMYLFFGALTTAISIFTFVLFYNFFSLNELFANIISWVCAVTFAYITNRIWVFKSVTSGKNLLKEIGSFFVCRLSTLGIEEVILFVFITMLSFNGTIVKLAAQLVVLVSNYVVSKIFVFKEVKK